MKLKHLHPRKRWVALSVEKKAVVLVVLFALIMIGLFGFAQYQDKQNEQFLRDIVADFDQLEADLEQELGIPVEDVSGCFTTSEKFSDGKTACFVRLESEGKSPNYVPTDTKDLILNYPKFNGVDEFRDGGYDFEYSGWPCKTGISDLGFYIECPVPVRAGNRDIVNSLF